MQTENIQEKFNACVKRIEVDKNMAARAMAMFSYKENRLLLSDESIRRWLIKDLQSKNTEAFQHAHNWKNWLINDGRKSILEDVINFFLSQNKLVKKRHNYVEANLFRLCPDESFEKKVISLACEKDTFLNLLFLIEPEKRKAKPSTEDVENFFSRHLAAFTKESYAIFIKKYLNDFMEKVYDVVPENSLDPFARWWQENGIPMPQKNEPGHVNRRIVTLMFKYPRAFSNALIDEAVAIECEAWIGPNETFLQNAEKVKLTKKPLHSWR